MSDAGARDGDKARTGGEAKSPGPLPGPVVEDGVVGPAGDVDETSAGGLTFPDEFEEVNKRDLGEKPVEPGP